MRVHPNLLGFGMSKLVELVHSPFDTMKKMENIPFQDQFVKDKSQEPLHPTHKWYKSPSMILSYQLVLSNMMYYLNISCCSL